MFLRPHQRNKDGKEHTYWSLVETVRTVDGPRQKTLCYLGELNGSAQARWLKSVEVFNEQGEAQQLKLFPSHLEVPDDDPQVARVLVNRVRLERTRQFGACFLGWEMWKQLGLDGFYEQALDGEAAEVPWWSQHADLLRCEVKELPQIPVALPDLLLRLLCRGDVGHGTDIFELARGRLQRASYNVEVLDRAVRHQQTMFKIKVCLVPGRAVESLLPQISVVGMNALEYELQGWLKRSIVLKDRIGFFRPVDVSVEHAPAEAACVAYALPLSQESFAAVQIRIAALQIRIEVGILQRNGGLRGQQLQYCDPVRREGARSQIVLQIECADELGLFDDG